MVDMHSAPIGAQEQLVVSCPNLGENNTFLGDSADEFTLMIQNQDLSAFTQNEKEICEVRNLHGGNILLDVNPLLELGIALGVFPQLDALLFDSEEWEPAIQEDLSGVAGLACAPLST